MPLGISIAQPTPRVQQLRAHTGDADRAMAKAAQARTKREDYREALIRLTGIDPDSV
jgi:outer membrane protein TolC